MDWKIADSRLRLQRYAFFYRHSHMLPSGQREGALSQTKCTLQQQSPKAGLKMFYRAQEVLFALSDQCTAGQQTSS